MTTPEANEFEKQWLEGEQPKTADADAAAAFDAAKQAGDSADAEYAASHAEIEAAEAESAK